MIDIINIIRLNWILKLHRNLVSTVLIRHLDTDLDISVYQIDTLFTLKIRFVSLRFHIALEIDLYLNDLAYHANSVINSSPISSQPMRNKAAWFCNIQFLSGGIVLYLKKGLLHGTLLRNPKQQFIFLKIGTIK